MINRFNRNEATNSNPGQAETNSKEGKLPALELARQINAAQSQLKARTRTAMARVAELSIVKSKLVESERERLRLDELLEESMIRMEKGLAPNEAAEQEWNRYCRNEERKQSGDQQEVRSRSYIETDFFVLQGVR